MSPSAPRVMLVLLALCSGLPSALAGDIDRGAQIVASRSTGLCLLCHRGPGAPEHLQGSLAPDLAHVGSRWTPEALEQRLREPQRFNPDSIMPAYGRRADADGGPQRIGRAWRGKALLDDGQIDDVVAYLATLK